MKDPTVPDPENRKKIMFYDSEKRQADLRIRLRYDGMNQSHFFRAMISGYLEKHRNSRILLKLDCISISLFFQEYLCNFFSNIYHFLRAQMASILDTSFLDNAKDEKIRKPQ